MAVHQMVPLPQLTEFLDRSEVMLHTTAAPPDLGAGDHPSSYTRQSHGLELLLVTVSLFSLAPQKRFPARSVKKYLSLKMTL